MLKRLANQKMSSAFLAWMEHCSNMSQQRSLLAKVIGRIAHTAVSAAMQAWWSMVEDRKQRMFVAKKCVSRLANMAAAVAFQGWESAVAEKMRRKTMLKKAVATLANSALHGALRTWHAVLENHRLRRETLLKVSRRMKCVDSPLLCLTALTDRCSATCVPLLWVSAAVVRPEYARSFFSDASLEAFANKGGIVQELRQDRCLQCLDPPLQQQRIHEAQDAEDLGPAEAEGGVGRVRWVELCSA